MSTELTVEMLRKIYESPHSIFAFGCTARQLWPALIAVVNWKEEALPLLHRYSELAMSFDGELGSSIVDNLERGVAKLREQAARVSELEVNNERLRKLLFRVVSHCNDETIVGIEMIADIRAEIGYELIVRESK